LNTVTKTFRLFGLTLWSYTITTQIDEEAVYQKLSARFVTEMEDAMKRAKA